MKKNYIFFFVSFLIVISSSIYVYSFLMQTKESLKNYTIKYFTNNAISLSKNIVDYIIKNYSGDLYEYLLIHKEKREQLNEYLSSFITNNNKNIFIAYKDNEGNFRIIADGAKNKNLRFEFNEKFVPLKKDEWLKLFTTKKVLVYSSNIKNIWLTLLYPFVDNNQIKFFLVYDFSIFPVKWLSNNIEMIQRIIKDFMVLIIVIITVLIVLILYDAKIQQKLKRYNLELQEEVYKKVEELREKDKKMLLQSRMALMGEMLNMIAHQWRQPLNSLSTILGNVEIDIALGLLDEKSLTKKIEEMNKIIQYLNETIETFSKFYRKDSKKTKVNIESLIDETINIILPTIKKYQVILKKDINCKKEITIYPNYFKQVLLNLIKNAVDIFKEKKIKNPKIIIRVFEENNKCIIEIEDNGGGVKEEIKNKIFEPYFTTKDEKNGTGLGLYMSKIIIENYLNGNIFQYNKANGAVFRIELKEIDE